MKKEIFDKETKKWFKTHPIEAQCGTTVWLCKDCGLMFIPILGHICKADKLHKREKKK